MGAHDDERVVIEASGAVRIEGPHLKERLRDAAGQWRWFGAGPELAVLARNTNNASRARLLLAGEIVSRTTVTEVVSMLAQCGWRGEFGVHARGHSRYLSIADGSLRAARSDLPAERLGELMVGMQLLSKGQLQSCVTSTQKERRLGELALQQRFITEDQLFLALRMQVHQIFQNALLEDTGHYALVQLPEDQTVTPAFLEHIALQELLMESIRRIDEMAVLRKRVPHGQVCPVLTARGAEIAVGEALRPVLALADGTRSILDMARVLHKDEYDMTKLVCHLLQIGAIDLKGQRNLNAQLAERMVMRFNQLHKLIFAAVQRERKHKALYRVLRAWIDEAPLAQYFGGLLTVEGTLAPSQVIALLARSASDDPLDSLHQALYELAAFSMLSAGSMLPREVERSLSQQVRRKLDQLRHPADARD